MEDDKRYVAKITIGTYYRVEDVIYYRANMTMAQQEKWRWYFEYLKARVKVSNPRKCVELIIGRMDDNVRVGQEWVEYKTGTLMRAKTSKLNQLMREEPERDLFGFGEKERSEKIEKVRADIEKLEKGEYAFYRFPEYINKIKEYIYEKGTREKGK